MKSLKKSKDDKKKSSPQETRWSDMASFYEGEESLALLAKGKSLTSSELRSLLSKGKTKPVSIRIPEVDLLALKRIAKIKKGKYQKLIIQAIEKFIDETEKKLAI
jgi:predicted DNA binding CopG/RHH family protein